MRAARRSKFLIDTNDSHLVSFRAFTFKGSTSNVMKLNCQLRLCVTAHDCPIEDSSNCDEHYAPLTPKRARREATELH